MNFSSCVRDNLRQKSTEHSALAPLRLKLVLDHIQVDNANSRMEARL